MYLHVFELYSIFGLSEQAEACELKTAERRGLLSTDEDLSTAIEVTETAQIVRHAFKRLRPTEQKIVLGYLADLPPEIIAHRCDVSVERVKIIWKQARLKLRRKLEPLL